MCDIGNNGFLIGCHCFHCLSAGENVLEVIPMIFLCVIIVIVRVRTLIILNEIKD